MRLPGQQITVKVTLFLCSFSIGTSAEWLIPTVDSPFTATIISPHLKDTRRKPSDENGSAITITPQQTACGAVGFHQVGSLAKLNPFVCFF